MNQLKEAEKKATLLVQEARKGIISYSYSFIFYNILGKVYIWSVSLLTCISVLLIRVCDSKNLKFYKFPRFDCADRVTKMKEAKSEAEKLISAYKSELETNYQASLAKVGLIVVPFLLHQTTWLPPCQSLHYNRWMELTVQQETNYRLIPPTMSAIWSKWMFGKKYSFANNNTVSLSYCPENIYLLKTQTGKSSFLRRKR